MIEVLENVPMPDFLSLDISRLKDGNYFKIPLADIKRDVGYVERLRGTARRLFGLELYALRGEQFVEFWVKDLKANRKIYENSILGSLRERADFVSIQELSNEFGMSYGDLRKILRELLRNKLVVMVQQKREKQRGRPLNLYRIA